MRIVLYCINAAIVDGWLLYWRHTEQLKVMKKSVLSLKNFQAKVGFSLSKLGKVNKRKRGRLSASPQPSTQFRRAATPAPTEDVRYDTFGHTGPFQLSRRCNVKNVSITLLEWSAVSDAEMNCNGLFKQAFTFRNDYAPYLLILMCIIHTGTPIPRYGSQTS